jgi:aryl-alcohol dehydrogenase-like predicted oxidoreductase
LQRLGGDHIDLYQFHLFDHETSIQETLNALNDVVRSREVRYLGASNLRAWQLMKAIGFRRAETYDRPRSAKSMWSHTRPVIADASSAHLLDQT